MVMSVLHVCVHVDGSTAEVYSWQWCSYWWCSSDHSVCSLRAVSRPSVKRVESSASAASSVNSLRCWYCLQWHNAALSRLSPQHSATRWRLC